MDARQAQQHAGGHVAEIWSAKAAGTLTNQTVTATPLRSGYDGSLTVSRYSNAVGHRRRRCDGAASGAPDVYLPASRPPRGCSRSATTGTGPSARTPVAGQQLQDQWIDTAVGRHVLGAVHGGAEHRARARHHPRQRPTNDRWNYAAVEVTPVAGTATATIALGAATAAQRSATAVGYYCTLHQPAAIASVARFSSRARPPAFRPCARAGA